MPPLIRHPRSHPTDEAFVARLARSKIYREFHRPDPDLRLCVGHANMLDHINASVLRAASAKNRSPSRSRNRSPRRHAEEDRDVGELKAQTVHVEDITFTNAENAIDPNWGIDFKVRGTAGHSTVNDDRSPSDSHVSITVSVVSVDAEDSDEYDEFGLPPRPAKQRTRTDHAPPLLTGSAAENEFPKGLLATLSVSEVLYTDAWEEEYTGLTW